MKKLLGGVAAVLMLGWASSALAEGGDAKAGATIFKRCAACHVVNEEKNRVGPYLVGIVGRKAGIAEKFKYSKGLLDMAAKGLVWDKANLDKYLEKPKAFIKGGKMAFAGLSKEKDRANVIAYLEAEAKKK